MTHQEVNSLIQAIHALWPTVPFQATHGSDMVRVWQLVLRDVTLEAAEVVVVDLARSGDRFPPTPGVIVEAVARLTATVGGTSAPDPAEAWATVLDAVRVRGWYRGAPDDWHPAIGSVVAALGWDEICHGDAMVVRAHFLRLYPEAVRRAETTSRQAATFAALGIGDSMFALPSAD